MKIVDGRRTADVEPYDFEIPQFSGKSTRCRVTEIDYQRNGVSGEGFFICRFMCSDAPERPFIGVVFDLDVEDPHPDRFYNPRTAVMDPMDLTSHWRGDHFDQGLRDAIVARYESIWKMLPDDDALEAEIV